MALISKENTFKNRCIDVVNQGELMCLSFAPLDSLSSDYLDDPIDIIEMSKTEESKEVGDGFVIFYIRHNLNTGYTEIE